jgi:hypothetical protein
MRIPTFWARASRDGYEAPGWSFDSIEEAKLVAEKQLAILIEVLEKARAPQGRYLYGDRPVREPVVETLAANALVTRNSYGALCLNTSDVVFVDVDVGEGSKQDGAYKLDAIRAAHARNPAWTLRVYRTRAGFRIALLHAQMSPTGPEIAQVFDAFGADPMYRKLCTMQESFRARLTPKPWRLAMSRLPGSFPWRDASVERRVNAWVESYDRARQEFAVCELVETLGAATPAPAIASVIAHHDAWVLAPGKPLA